jgi:hypothetical protein
MNWERKRKSVRICGLFFSCLRLLKGLVGEGYLRVERLELKLHQKRQELKAVPDPRLVGTAYRLTRKGRALLSGAPAPQMNRSGAPAPQMNGSPR